LNQAILNEKIQKRQYQQEYREFLDTQKKAYPPQSHMYIQDPLYYGEGLSQEGEDYLQKPGPRYDSQQSYNILNGDQFNPYNRRS